MKITVLDGYTLNPGDLDWSELKKLGDCKIYDRTPYESVVERSYESEIVLTNKTIIDKEAIYKLSNLKYIGVLATGYNIVDIAAAKNKGIIVTNIPTYGSDSVAQMVFAHILNLTQRVAHHAQTVKNKVWANGSDFCYWDYPLIELKDKTIGIIGFGRIGKTIARIALAFKMKVNIFDVFPTSNLEEGIKSISLEELLKTSDFVSLNCPLTKDNEGMIDYSRLLLMKPTAFLINTSRGPLINEEDLAKALNNGLIAGAGLDVLKIEPPVKDNVLYEASNCYITPHISWATKDARNRLLNIAVNNIKEFLNGNPINVIE